MTYAPISTNWSYNKLSNCSSITNINSIGINIGNSQIQNAPNPFSEETEITFNVDESGNTLMRIFDLSGKEVSILQSGILSEGMHSIHFDAKNLPAGIYICQLQTEKTTSQKRIIVSR